MPTKETENFFKQYEIGINMADKISQRRGENNKFYSAILLAFISSVIAIFKNDVYENFGFIFILSSLGIVFSAIWLFSIKSYKTINIAKYKVLLDMEKALSYRLYTNEYQYLNEYKHKSLTEIEKFVPISFIIAFFLILLFSLLKILYF